MKLYVEWDLPILMRRSTRKTLEYSVDLETLPKAPGVYILGRRWGKQFEALYVGKANIIRSRVKTQLNNLRLMQHLDDAKTGRRILLVGKVRAKGGQQVERILPLVERALIRHFLSEGHDLVNKQGTRLPRHEVVSSGKQPRRFVPGVMYLQK